MPISALYDNIPLLLLPPDLDAGATSITRDVDTDDFEGDAGGTLNITHNTSPNAKEQIAFLCTSRDELNELEAFLSGLDGRARSFFLPTWSDDLDVLSSDGTSMIIRDIGYAENLLPIFAMRTLFVVSQSDYTSWRIRTINDAESLIDGTEELTGEFNVSGFEGATSATHRYMFLRFVRLDSDDLTIEYLDGGRAIVTVPVVNIPANYPPWNPVNVSSVYLASQNNGVDKLANIGGYPAGEPGASFIDVQAIPSGTDVVVSGPDLVFRSQPIANNVILIGQFSVTSAVISGANAIVYQNNGQRWDVVIERGGVDVGRWSTPYYGGSFAGGVFTVLTDWVEEFPVFIGDIIRAEIFSHIALKPGQSDDGARSRTFYGGGWQSWLFVPGFITK